MRFILMIPILLWAHVTTWAHSPNKAFYQLEEVEDGLIIQAEFPWTLRNALDDYKADQGIEASETYMVVLEKYIQEKVKIMNEKGQEMCLDRLEILSQEIHDHAAMVQLYYSGGRWYQIHNEVMFELYSDQVHHIRINDEGGPFEASLTAAKPEMNRGDLASKPGYVSLVFRGLIGWMMLFIPLWILHL